MDLPKSKALWLVGVPCLCAILTALGILFTMGTAKKRLSDYQGELRRKGEKLTWEEFAKAPASQEDERIRELSHTGEEIKREVERKKIRPISPNPFQETAGFLKIRHKLPVIERGGGDNSWDALQADLEPIDKDLAKIRELCRQPIPETNAESRPSVGADGDVQNLLAAANALHLQIMWELHNGELPAAAEGICTLFKLARTIGNLQKTDQFISHLVTLDAATTTWEFLQAERPAAQDLANLQAAWSENRPNANLAASLRLWRAKTLPAFGDSSAAQIWLGMPTTRKASVFKDALPMGKVAGWMLLHSSDELAYTKTLQELIDSVPAGDGNWSAFLRSSEDMKKEGSRKDLGHTVTHRLLSILPNEIKFALMAENFRSLCLAAVALRRYQLEHDGHLPTSLRQLVPAELSSVPPDPMDGKPLRYQPVGISGFLLYSVGTDTIDNRGKADARNGSNTTFWPINDTIDFVWPSPEKVKK